MRCELFHLTVAVQELNAKNSRLFRDTSAWYHVVIAYDTTQTTSSDRAKLYVNGVEAALSVSTYPNQNDTLGINNNISHVIGRYEYAATNYRLIHIRPLSLDRWTTT